MANDHEAARNAGGTPHSRRGRHDLVDDEQTFSWPEADGVTSDYGGELPRAGDYTLSGIDGLRDQPDPRGGRPDSGLFADRAEPSPPPAPAEGLFPPWSGSGGTGHDFPAASGAYPDPWGDVAPGEPPPPPAPPPSPDPFAQPGPYGPGQEADMYGDTGPYAERPGPYGAPPDPYGPQPDPYGHPDSFAWHDPYQGDPGGQLPPPPPGAGPASDPRFDATAALSGSIVVDPSHGAPAGATFVEGDEWSGYDPEPYAAGDPYPEGPYPGDPYPGDPYAGDPYGRGGGQPGGGGGLLRDATDPSMAYPADPYVDDDPYGGFYDDAPGGLVAAFTDMRDRWWFGIALTGCLALVLGGIVFIAFSMGGNDDNNETAGILDTGSTGPTTSQPDDAVGAGSTLDDLTTPPDVDDSSAATSSSVPGGVVVVPDVTGLGYIVAGDNLRAEGLTVNVQFEEAPDATENIVLRQSPSAGEQVTPGTAITIVAAEGSDDETTITTAEPTTTTTAGSTTTPTSASTATTPTSASTATTPTSEPTTATTPTSEPTTETTPTDSSTSG